MGLETRLGGERQIIEQGGGEGRKERRDSFVPRLIFSSTRKSLGTRLKKGVVEQLATYIS